ncbi:MAG: DUF1822 family protein [Mastigocoleus sp.]
MLKINDWIEIYPEHLWLEVSASEQEALWRKSLANDYSNKSAHHRSFINDLCLNAFLKWLEDEPDLQKKLNIHKPSYNLYQRWEFVHGIELISNHNRLVIIPNEQDDIREFRIPQEWVDIHNWAANYYLAAQLNLEEEWLRIWGFVSYEKVRKKAQYDSIDRTYRVQQSDMIADIDIMWLTQELCATNLKNSALATTKPQLEPLPKLSEIQGIKVIEQLSKPTLYSPRLDIDFKVWGTILSSDKYQELLYEQRIKKSQGYVMENAHKIVQNLNLWYENIFSEGWQTVDELLNLADMKAFQFRSDSVLNEICVKGAKLIDLGLQLERKSVVLLIGLSPQIDSKVGVRVQLYPVSGETYLPASLKLSLLSESGKTIQSVESRSYDNYIQLRRFKLPLGKFFSIQVILKDVNIIENFILENFVCS